MAYCILIKCSYHKIFSSDIPKIQNFSVELVNLNARINQMVPSVYKNDSSWQKFAAEKIRTTTAQSFRLSMFWKNYQYFIAVCNK